MGPCGVGCKVSVLSLNLRRSLRFMISESRDIQLYSVHTTMFPLSKFGDPL